MISAKESIGESLAQNLAKSMPIGQSIVWTHRLAPRVSRKICEASGRLPAAKLKVERPVAPSLQHW